MSDALEALERMIGIPASVGVCEPVEGFAKRPQDAVDCMREMAAEITRLRAALEQPSTAGRPSEDIRQRASDIEDAIAAGDMSAEQVYTQMWQLVDKTSCQPSTAEARAMALDNLAAKLKAEANEVDVGRGHILTTIEIVEHEAKRIREEG